MTGPAAPHNGGGIPVAMVSGNDLLARFDSQTERLTRIETLVTDTPRQLQHLAEQIAPLTTRIGELERWRAFWTGITAVVALLLTSGVVAAILTALHH